MASLKIKKLNIPLEDLSQVPSLLEEQGVEFVCISNVNWPDNYPYKPEASFRIARAGDGFIINYKVSEETVKADAEDGGAIWEDSCCEFFSSPADDGVYYNLEANCTGHILLCCGDGRNDRKPAPQEVLKSVRRWSSLGPSLLKEQDAPKEWQMVLYMPFSAYFGHSIKEVGSLKANFYKCGDGLKTPHFLSWSPIATPSPDFHRPEFFGDVILED